MKLPDGVEIKQLSTHPDTRGSFTEAFRQSWYPDFKPLQWNVVQNKAGVFRGIHVHKKHWDYLLFVTGEVIVSVSDFRSGSPTEGLSQLVTLKGDNPQAVVIPPGVGHGFYFLTPGFHIYAMTHYWDGGNEPGCHFLDPALGLDWPNKNPILSTYDQHLPPLLEILHLVPPYKPAKKVEKPTSKRTSK
jgi:dTDP-4-dehydrorhamnose 3,5-epimerase